MKNFNYKSLKLMNYKKAKELNIIKKIIKI